MENEHTGPFIPRAVAGLQHNSPVSRTPRYVCVLLSIFSVCEGVYQGTTAAAFVSYIRSIGREYVVVIVA